jgi:hypothetical protein
MWSLGCGGGGGPGGTETRADTGVSETGVPDAGGETGVDSVDAGGDVGTDAAEDAGGDAGGPNLPYAKGVVAFEPGRGAGYGQDRMPEVVLGPPKGGGSNRGGQDVVALGEGGEIVVEFGERGIVDGEGADFIVFENAFYAGGDPEEVYQELGEVSVSKDGENWETFQCDTEPAEPGRWPGCAGWRPVQQYDAEKTVPLEPAITGGDPFDLEEVGLEEARYVRIEGLSGEGFPPSVGFDLDAVGIINKTKF